MNNAVSLIDTIPDQEPPKHYGVVTGRVINPFDPQMLGRVQVELPFIDSIDLQPWARVATPMAGPGHGFYFIPNFGDEVLVAFEHGDVSAPYILGSLYNYISFPPLPTPVPQIRTVRTITGNQVVFTEVPPTLTLQNGPTVPEVVPSPPSIAGPHQTIMLDNIGVQIVGLTCSTVTSGAIIQKAGGAIDFGAGGAITQTAGGTIALTAGAAVTVAATTITLSVGSSTIIISPDGVKIIAPTVNVIGVLQVNGTPLAVP